MKKYFICLMILLGFSYICNAQNQHRGLPLEPGPVIPQNSTPQNNNRPRNQGFGPNGNPNQIQNFPPPVVNPNPYPYYGSYWLDNYGPGFLGLTPTQQYEWNNVIILGRSKQQLINDSIKHYVREIYRLEKRKSPMVDYDMQQIKQILTPAQYTEFLERLVNYR